MALRLKLLRCAMTLSINSSFNLRKEAIAETNRRIAAFRKARKIAA